MMHWLILAVAIVVEVIATTALKPSNGFTRLWPSLVVEGNLWGHCLTLHLGK